MRLRHAQGGMTLAEVLVAMALVALMLLPALDALRSGVAGSGVHADIAADTRRLASRMETLLASDFQTLEDAALAAGGPAVPTTLSDPAGVPGRLRVFLAHYDVDNADADGDRFTGTEPDLLWLRVEVEGTVHALEALRGKAP